MSDSILKTIREAIVGSEDNEEFDPELILNINSSLLTLNQNGVGSNISVKDTTTTWKDFENSEQDNYYFEFIPTYVTLNTRILFDPPPPSNVEYYNNRIEELLWRLREAYREVET